MRGDDALDGLRGETLLEGRYRLLSRIASGGMASVYVAEHTLIGRTVAIKILHQQYAEDAECVRRFLDEGRTIGTLGHPHIVESTDMGRTSTGAPFLVLELLEGRTLEQELRNKGRLPVQRSLRIAQQIASALAAAHAKGIIHRDLKSGNVFLVNRTDGDHAKVLDFGISKFMEGRGHTQKGRLLGTPWFMSPEQINDPASVDVRCDVYALGVIIYEMLAGQVPFAEAPFPLVFTKILHEQPPPLRSIRREVTHELETLVSTALAKSPADRFPTMEVFSAALARLVGPYWLEMRARARSQSDFEVARTLRASGTPTPDILDAEPTHTELEPRGAPPVSGPPPPAMRPPTRPPTGPAIGPAIGPRQLPLPPPPTADVDPRAMAKIISRSQTVPPPPRRSMRFLGIGLVAAAVAIGAIAMIAVLSRSDGHKEARAPDPKAVPAAPTATAPGAPAVGDVAPPAEAAAPAAGESAAPPASQTPTGEAPPAAPAAAAATPPAPAESSTGAKVHLTIRSSARGATASFRGETYRLPLVHREVARSDQEETVEVSAPGRPSRTYTVTLDRDRRVVADLEPAGRERSRASAPSEPAAESSSVPTPFAGPNPGSESAGATGGTTPAPAPSSEAKPPAAPPARKAERPAVAAVEPGTIDQAAVRREIERIKPQVRTCHERGRMDNPQLAGRVVVRVYVDPSGRVTHTRIASSTLGNRSVEACIEELVETWTLPAPAGGVAGAINYVVNLK
ncbi:MAG TPA: protein kinase [Kofleriaceae bacterium]|nr:protein kinase [Kofleriaceae bacterium]